MPVAITGLLARSYVERAACRAVGAGRVRSGELPALPVAGALKVELAYTRKRASRGRRLARSAAGARGLPAAARLVCARPARSVAVGVSWLCRERPGPVTAERLELRPRAHFSSRVLWVSTYTEREHRRCNQGAAED